MRHVCVYCSSSDRLDAGYLEVATEFGRTLASRGDVLVYGGGSTGLMGAVARGVKDGGGRVVGIIPEFMVARELAFLGADELVAVETMRERKRLMEERSDAFVALPGGWGTLEEIMEILVLRQLARHGKPTVFLNHAGYYDHLLSFFERMIADRFGKENMRSLYSVCANVNDVFARIDDHVARPTDEKWFDTK